MANYTTGIHLGQYLSVKKMSASYLVGNVREFGNWVRGGRFRSSLSSLFGLSGLSGLFCSLNQTNQTNQTDQMNPMDQLPATRRSMSDYKTRTPFLGAAMFIPGA
jgi:hypothetical protein